MSGISLTKKNLSSTNFVLLFSLTYHCIFAKIDNYDSGSCNCVEYGSLKFLDCVDSS